MVKISSLRKHLVVRDNAEEGISLLQQERLPNILGLVNHHFVHGLPVVVDQLNGYLIEFWFAEKSIEVRR